MQVGLTGRRLDGRRFLELISAVALAVCFTGCGRDGTPADTIATPTPPISPAGEATTPVPRDNAVEPPGGGFDHRQEGRRQPADDRPSRIFSPGDRRSFRQLTASLPGQEGVAISAVGRDQPVERLGSLRTGVAWSTAKVPVAMAAIASGRARTADLSAAITASDNAAAERLWASLGGGSSAAAAADDELRAAGDRTTVVESRRLRAGFTAFGQTDWPVADQARFTAGLPCTDTGASVLDFMGETVASQRWGLGTSASAQIKGGWGPGTRPGQGGGYMDRQMGIVPIGGKLASVALISQPADGTHQTGTQHLTALARWVTAHAGTRRLTSEANC